MRFWILFTAFAAGDQRQRRLQNLRSSRWSIETAMLDTTMSPPAPAAISALNITTTTLPPSLTTMLSPQERLGGDYVAYENEMTYGRAEENATDMPNIANEQIQLTTTQAYADYSVGDSGDSVTSTVKSPGIGESTPVTPTDEEFRRESSLDCKVGDWSEWGECQSSGGIETIRSWHEARHRPVTNPHSLGGLPCAPLVMRRPCPNGGWSSEKMKEIYGYSTGGFNGNRVPDGDDNRLDYSDTNERNCPCQANESTAVLFQESMPGGHHYDHHRSSTLQKHGPYDRLCPCIKVEAQQVRQ
jgi:hypothetical protein